MAESLAFNMDCMEALKEFPDQFFDLCVADPPYNINRFKHGETSRLHKYGSLNSVNNLPFTKEHFEQLKRVSKNQIIWGYNHLSEVLPKTSEFIFWYKHQPVDTYADGELAWTSFNKTAKCFDYPYFGSIGADMDGRITPTQKPINLYIWLYAKYLSNGGVILDPFLGSGSSRIAAYNMGFDFYGYEIDKTYFDLQEERFAKYSAQQNLFLDE